MFFSSWIGYFYKQVLQRNLVPAVKVWKSENGWNYEKLMQIKFNLRKYCINQITIPISLILKLSIDSLSFHYGKYDLKNLHRYFINYNKDISRYKGAFLQVEIGGK